MAAITVQNRDRSPLTREQLQAGAPSIFATEAHESRSRRYLYVPTVTVLDALDKEGFVPVWAATARTRDASRRSHTKHMIRLAKAEDAANVARLMRERAPVVNLPAHPEVVLTNSHDGTTSYKLDAGLFRLVCSNGMVVTLPGGESFRYQHSVKWEGDIIEGTYRVLDHLTGPVAGQIAAWQETTLSPDAILAVADRVAQLRWHGETPPVAPERLLMVRRSEDRGDTAWQVLNRVQENVMNGGLGYWQEGRRGRHVSTRPITGIDDLSRLNRGIWEAVASVVEGREPVAVGS